MLWTLFNFFVEAPYLIIVPLALVALLRWRRATMVTNIAVGLWGLYLIYEFALWLGIGCDPDCDIRVDLIVLAPLLIAVTLLAAWSAFRPIKKDGE